MKVNHFLDTQEDKNIIDNQYVLVPVNMLERIIDYQKEILSVLKSSISPGTDSIGDYISEAQAKKILGRKATWWWQMRNSQQLPYSKVGNKVFYLEKDILNLLNKNHNAIKQ